MKKFDFQFVVTPLYVFTIWIVSFIFYVAAKYLRPELQDNLLNFAWAITIFYSCNVIMNHFGISKPDENYLMTIEKIEDGLVYVVAHPFNINFPILEFAFTHDSDFQFNVNDRIRCYLETDGKTVKSTKLSFDSCYLYKN